MNGNRQTMRQRGLSLVEILVAMTIAMIILAGVTQSLITNQRNSQWSDSVAYIQENARYASDLLAHDVRLAGYFGCALKGARHFNSINSGGNLQYDISKGIEGWDGDETLPSGLVLPALWSSVSGNTKPDIFVIHRADDSLDLGVASHNPNAAQFKLTRNNPMVPGDLAIVVGDTCSDVSLVQMTGPSSGGTNVEFVHNAGGSVSPGNCTKIIKYDSSFDCSTKPPNNACGGGGKSGSANCAYGPGSTMMRYVAHVYYIAPSAGDSSVPALYREALQNNSSSATASAISDELVTGVEDMQLKYGVDVDGDGNADRYADAKSITDPEWEQVVSARIDLVLRSYQPVLEQDKAVTLLNHAYNDKYLRQLVTTTVRLRNVGIGG